jgi:hypothetical protein
MSIGETKSNLLSIFIKSNIKSIYDNEMLFDVGIEPLVEVQKKTWGKINESLNMMWLWY